MALCNGDATSKEQWQALYCDILAVIDWLQTWQLRINLEKCEVLHLSRYSLEFSYSVNNKVISAKDFCRESGVYGDNPLNFHRHCLNVARIAHRKSELFFKAFSCQHHEFYIFTFTTYIRPIVESDTQVWNPHHRCDIDIIKNVQRRFTKFLPGLFNVPYSTRLNTLNLKSLEVRRIMNDLISILKIIRNQVDLLFGK